MVTDAARIDVPRMPSHRGPLRSRLVASTTLLAQSKEFCGDLRDLAPRVARRLAMPTGEEKAMHENARGWRTASWLAELAAGNPAHGSTTRRGSNRPGELATPDSGRRLSELTGVRSRTLVKLGFTLLRKGQDARAEDASTGAPCTRHVENLWFLHYPCSITMPMEQP